MAEMECIDKNGKKYRTVSIGGMIWTAENLDYNVDSSWSTPYGRLYTLEAAKEACNSLGNGWCLPNLDDRLKLLNAVGEHCADVKLKAAPPRWDGTNETGLSALPSGYYLNGEFCDLGSKSYWWLVDNDFVGYWDISSGNGFVSTMGKIDCSKFAVGFSVRCVRD